MQRIFILVSCLLIVGLLAPNKTFAQERRALAADDEARAFDPSAFQNPAVMSALYRANKDKQALRGSNYFMVYISAFIGALDHKIVFLEGGALCKPLISAIASSNNTQDGIEKATHGGLMSTFGDSPGLLNTQTYLQAANQGENDALTLFSLYRCTSDVTTTIMNNINAVYGVGAMRPGTSMSGSQDSTRTVGGSPNVELASVASPQLNLRDASSRDGGIVGRLNAGQLVQILRHLDNGWVEVKSVCLDGAECQGFVNGNYLRSAASQ